MTWHATALTLFPAMFPGPLAQSLAGRALERGLWRLDVTDIREAGLGRHRAVDDTPFGGGAGMVMRADVLDAAIGPDDGRPLVYLSPRGEKLTQPLAAGLAAGPGVRLLCGRFEGVDERLIQARNAREVSIGDYVLSGGELPALVLLDCCVRLVPGVMGAADSAVESFSGGLLEYPHYTRPADWAGRPVPDVLLSGNHAAIAELATRAQSERITRERRPDLWRRFEHTNERTAP